MASEGVGRGTESSEQPRTSSSSSSSYCSPPREFSFDDSDAADGSSLLLSAKAVEMTPADEIFFGGHLLPLHLLSHFSRLPSSNTDDSDTFTLPIEGYPTYSDRSTSSNESRMDDSIRGKCGNKVNRETTPPVSPSDVHERGNKSIPLSLFGLSRWQRARDVQVDEGDRDKERRMFRFELKKTVKRYARMARPLLSFRGKTTEEDRESRGQKLTSSPRNSGLLVRSPELPGTVKDGRVEELQAAIQAAIAYCKKSIAAEEEGDGKLHTLTNIKSTGESHLDKPDLTC